MQTIVVRNAPVFGTGMYLTDAFLRDPRVQRRLRSCVPAEAWRWPQRDQALVALAPEWAPAIRAFHSGLGADFTKSVGPRAVGTIDTVIEVGLRRLVMGDSLQTVRVIVSEGCRMLVPRGRGR